MSDLPEPSLQRRCPQCDGVVADDATLCLLCGAALPEQPATPEPEPVEVAPLPEPEPVEEASPVVETEKVEEDEPISAEIPPLPVTPSSTPKGVVEPYQRKRLSGCFFWATAALIGTLLLIGAMFLRARGDQLALALVPTITPIPPTPTYTPTWTPVPSDTPEPTIPPTETPLPPPTDTPQPPRFHQVEFGETLYGLSLLYRISADSIAETNGFTVDSPSVTAGEQLQIPWPTPTPPLESMLFEQDGQTFLADVTDCQMYTIEQGDSLLAMAGKFDVPSDVIVQVNRMTQERIDLLQPGDTFCIPQIVDSGMLPPTPGPSPTPTPTSYPAGPQLLYPVNETVIEPADKTLTLQWAAVKDLAEDEWYMVELMDDSVMDSLPYRGFTRDTAFKVPADWRPSLFTPETHNFRWRVSIVQVTGQRADGVFIYTYGGRESQDAYFSWLSATPTPTPTPTPLPTATPTPE